MVKQVPQGEKIVTPEVSLSNEQWNAKTREQEAKIVELNKKLDDRDNVIKQVANMCMTTAMNLTENSAGLNSIAKQIMQIVMPPQQNQQNPNNKA
jgi:hypothetical protein